MMPIYQQFGMSLEGVEPSNQLKSIGLCEAQIAKKGPDLWLNLHSIPLYRAVAAVRFYLIGDYASARKFGLASLEPATEYFTGNWRNVVKTDLGTIDVGWWHSRERWVQLFGGVLLWGTTLGEWDALRLIAKYPDGRRSVDLDDATPALRQLYIELSHLLRDEAVRGIGARVGELAGSDFRATAVLAQCLDAINDHDEAGANQLLDEFFRRRHRRKGSKNVMDSISPDGTTVVNLARRRGLKVVLKPDLELYCLSLPDESVL